MTVMDYAKKEIQDEFNSDVWIEAAQKSYTLDNPTNELFKILGYCEYTTSNKNSLVEARVVLDGVVSPAPFASDSFSPAKANAVRGFMFFGVESIGAGLHAISLKVKASTSSETIRVRNVRLLVEKF